MQESTKEATNPLATAGRPSENPRMKERFPHFLLGIYVLLFLALAIDPFARDVWFAENLPVVIIVVALVATFRRFRFSNVSYAMMAVFIIMHTIGGHFTFERVPFDFVSDLFGFERNHYDRIAHFSVGFYAYPTAELLVRKKLVSSRVVLFLFPVFAVFTVAAVYEIIEWQYAVLSDPDAGIAFLGSQGDIWDAQKDMLADGLGSIVATIVFFLMYRESAPTADEAPASQLDTQADAA